MKKKHYSIAIILMIIPVLVFVWVFRSLEFSNTPNDWQIFAAYFSGTVGTVASIYAGYLVYRTFDLQAQTFSLQAQQSADQLFSSYLQNFTMDKTLVANALEAHEREVHDAVRNAVKSEKGDVRAPNTIEVVEMFIEPLKERFIADYSRNTATPRLNIYFNKYFQYINAFCWLFLEIKTKESDDKHYNQLRSLLLTKLHDSEIKMICYYYYIFYDIVNSTDQAFTAANPVKQSGLLGGNLFLSDDFSRNIDPRTGDFDHAIEVYRQQVSALRKQMASDNYIKQNSSPDIYGS